MNRKKKNGFSLIEVNMAIFVMATAVLAIAALYPMGLRESIQSQTDFKQVMFADYVLNIAVAMACSTNVYWKDWSDWANARNLARLQEDAGMQNMGELKSVPEFASWSMRSKLKQAIENDYPAGWRSGAKHTAEGKRPTYAVYCVLVPGFSDTIMGIMVRSLDGDPESMAESEVVRRLEMQPVYYAEARFQGRFDAPPETGN